MFTMKTCRVVLYKNIQVSQYLSSFFYQELASVDQVLSAQCLLTPSLDQYQTWCSGCPQWVDDPY